MNITRIDENVRNAANGRQCMTMANLCTLIILGGKKYTHLAMIPNVNAKNTLGNK